MTQTDATLDSPTTQLSHAGVSIWLDDINRENFNNGKLAALIADKNVVGVTTNPTIFAGALSKGNAYDAQMSDLKKEGASVDEALFQITTHDVQQAADLFRDIYDQTRGYDGRVSIEVSPSNAYDVEATIIEANRLWDTVDRPNIMIKIPATIEGLDAIRRTIAQGISVNVTLIFGLARYRAVIDAYLDGLEAAAAADLDLSSIHSVASFFISRVDTEVNKRLAVTDEATQAALSNRVGVANARLAYQVFQQAFSEDRARDLLDRGANYQRPLWASTGVKSDDIPDTYYVTELIADQTVNTMPLKTLDAVADHGDITGDTVTYRYEAAEHIMAQLEEAGVDINEVTELLEREGVDKFITSWQEFGDTVQRHLGN